MSGLINLENGCIFAGQGDKFEIWNEADWKKIAQGELDLSSIPKEDWPGNAVISF